MTTATLPTTEALADTAAKGKLAQNAEKLPAGKTLDSFSADRYWGEPKADGWRLLVHRHENGVSLYTRNGKRHDGSLPAIEAELAAALPPGTWIDTEAIGVTLVDGKIAHEWGVVQSVLGSGTAKAAAQADKISLMAFDLLAHGGLDARSLPLAQRRDLLERVFETSDFERTILMPRVQPTEASYAALLAQGFEGMVVKDRKARYASGQRGKGWTKIKATWTDDVVVMDFKPGENGFAGMVGAVIFGKQAANGEGLVETGRCSGMDMRTRENMTKNPGKWLGTVIEIAHMGEMPTGGLRHPQFKRRRNDKAATDCIVGVEG